MTHYPIPPGWKLVPVEPTEEMARAGRRFLFAWPIGKDGFGPLTSDGVYRAAIAAAPQPPTPIETAAHWHLGTMNDGLFIIDAVPRPSTDDVVHDRTDGPTLILNVTDLPHTKAEAIADAHNAAIETLTRRLAEVTKERDAAVAVIRATEKGGTVYAVVERVLDERSAWVARPDHETTFRVALAAVIAANSLLGDPAGLSADVEIAKARLAEVTAQRDSMAENVRWHMDKLASAKDRAAFAEASLATLTAAAEKAKKALGELSSQWLSSEMEDDAEPDFEAGYDQCVKVAREAFVALTTALEAKDE